MKITKRQLRQIIKEEKSKLLEEGTRGSAFGWGFGSFSLTKHRTLPSPMVKAHESSDSTVIIIKT